MGLRTGFILTCVVMGLAGSAFADGDAEAGEKVFRKCKACHKIGEGAKNGVGPNLTGVVGRTIGSEEGFKYSDAFMEKNAEGMVWSDEHLSEYLANPRDYIPKNKMSFAGLKKEDDVEDVIAYIETFQ